VSALDAVLPEPAHRELHRTRVAAAPDAVWDAVFAVTPRELLLADLLLRVRELPVRLAGRDAGLAAARDEPLLAPFLREGFRVLVEDRPRTWVMGAVGRPWRLRDAAIVAFDDLPAFAAFDAPGVVKIALSFELAPQDGGTLLLTETRVAPTDPAAARAFARYWRVIRPGSDVIRRDWLRAIRRRAERDLGARAAGGRSSQ